MPINQSQGNCQYTLLNTAGTTTINQAPQAPSNAQLGAFYGLSQITAGTTFGVTVYDIIPAVGSVAVATNTLITGTGTAGQTFLPAGSSLGVRYRGALVAVAAGTPGAVNLLWD
jgi:hypothetical protein